MGTPSKSKHPAATRHDKHADKLVVEVAHRVRAMRARRGLTRKNLAHHSEISERYLAQVEGGAANVSLILLARISDALGVPIESLLPNQNNCSIEHEQLGTLIDSMDAETQHKAYQLLSQTFTNQADLKRKGVALIGLRGAGKSTLGEHLARHQATPFVRLDEMISGLAGLEMGELISLTGQNVFRRYELEALQKTRNDYQYVIVEAGGSLVSEAETYKLLRRYFFTVWVRAQPEDHMNRVTAQGDLRPLDGQSQPMHDLKRILKERASDYAMADYELMTSGRSIDSCLKNLVEVTNPYLQQ
ncbi:MAG: helix-turn-helix transcriptional regulator [Gammaproteobacteria bacterium]|nr:helix-turn-helix transcriptional regulator [Gammaproteobacteria bacterium]